MNESQNDHGIALLGQSYVSKIFKSTSVSESSILPQFRFFVKNQMVFALGVVLLKIFYDESISSFQIAQDFDEHENETSITEIFIAYRLINVINTRELSNYVKATAKCVRCTFDSFDCSLNDDDFRKSFIEKIIVSLRKDYDYVMSIEL